MIKEAIVARTGIIFKDEPLISMGFDFVQLAYELDRLGLDVQSFGLNPSLLQGESTPSTLVSHSPAPATPALIPVPSFYSSLFATALDHSQHFVVAVKHAMDIRDAVADIYDQLVSSKNWWALEFIPMLTIYQEHTGKWTRKRV